MAKLVSNYTANGSSTTDEYGTFVTLNRFLSGDVVEGLAVAANATPGMNVYVQPGSGRISTGTYPASYGYLIAVDTALPGENVTIATAAASARIDYIVGYIDKSVAGSTSGANVNNTNNVLKFASVAGTPSGSPVVPTTAQIQTAIGAANPYIILAQIAVAANATQITNPNITDKRNFIGPTVPSRYLTSSQINFGGSGAGVWWEEVGRTTLGSAASSIAVSFSSRRYLTIIGYLPGTAATISPVLTFNSDTGSNYVYRSTLNGQADTTNFSQASVPLYVFNTGAMHTFIMNVQNPSTAEKVMDTSISTGYGTGAATIQDRRAIMARWCNTSVAASSVQITTSSSTFTAGAELIVLGHN